MRQKNQATALSWIALCLLMVVPAQARPFHGGGDLFEAVAGAWSGGGTVRTEDGAVERLRCRAAFRPSGPDNLSLELRCASDSFKLDVASTIVRSGDHISGGWRESSFGASGDIAGTISGSQISAAIQGMGMSGRLSMNVHGSSQTVALTAENVGAVSMVLHRE